MQEVRRYIDFYEGNKIIPVRQDLSDLRRHFRRRDALYRQLGLVPGWFGGQKVIEFGPGTGDNAIHIASKKPALYVLVDANPYSISSIKERISDGRIDLPSVEVVHEDVLAYSDERRYDLVLCEGMLDGQEDSARYLTHLASFSSENGVVVTTTSDHVSLYADVCRRMVKPIFEERYPESDKQLAKLIEFFTPDFAATPHMSKLPEDWVLDGVLHPWTHDHCFPFELAVAALDGKFDVHGASPNFLTDWRWYKTITDDDPGFNGRALEEYAKKRVAMLDYRADPSDMGSCDDAAVAELCTEAFHLHVDIWNGGDSGRIPEFLDLAERIATLVETALPGTAKALRDYSAGMRTLIKGSETGDLGDFLGMFGRAQQYVCFIRRWD